MYYNLHKGVQLGVFKVKNIKKESGQFSWGDSVEKIYYELGEFAQPKVDKRIKEYLDKKDAA